MAEGEGTGAKPETTGTSAPAHLTVEWKTAATGSAVTALAALTALVVLHGSRSEALGSTAILLAIIAFLVQLIVFIAQAVQSNHTALRLEQIAASLQTSMGMVNKDVERMGSDVRELRQSNQSFANNVVDEVSEELAESPTSDPAEIARLVKETLVSELERALPTQLSDGKASPVEDGSHVSNKEAGPPRARMANPTGSERSRAVPVLAELSDDALYELTRVKAIENTIPDYKVNGAWTDRAEDDPVLIELAEAGLLSIWSAPPPDRRNRPDQEFVSLAVPLGLEAGRVLHADEYVSNYLSKQPVSNGYRAQLEASDQATGS